MYLKKWILFSLCGAMFEKSLFPAINLFFTLNLIYSTYTMNEFRVCVFFVVFFHWAAYVSICSRFLIIFPIFSFNRNKFWSTSPFFFYGYRLFLLRKSVKSKASSTVFKRTEWSLLWILQASYENLNKSSIEARKFHNLY